MPKVVWSLTHIPTGGSPTDITAKVFSVSVNQGRPQYLDQYPGGGMTVTINNSGDYASGIAYGSVLYLNDSADNVRLICWVQEVTFRDAPGGVGVNTATITAVDWISRAGRIQANSFSIAQAGTGTQLATFSYPTGPLPADMVIASMPAGSSTASAITYTGTVANYLNLLQSTERGFIVYWDGDIYFVTRTYVANFSPATVGLGRTTSTTQIAYQQLNRIQNGVQFINTATITSTGVADQTVTNSTAAATYGPAFYSSQTVDYDATQASGNASWIANNFSDPASLRFECSFTDVAQNATALTNFMSGTMGGINRVMNLGYTVPGGSPTTVKVVVDGYSLNITPEETTFRFNLSPLQYYQFFTLNSSTLGILDTSRLGW